MGWNVPDDWGSYYRNCELCGGRYHASEGGCYCTEEKELCVGENCGNSRDLDSYHDYTEVTEVGGRKYCQECLICECCEETKEGLIYSEDHVMLLCERCVPEDHWCPNMGPLLDHMTNVISSKE